MKTATRADKPEWLSVPIAVTTARVCSLSGKLATEGCQDVEVVGKDGNVERRSLVYTEYFASGTQPTTFCDMHPTQGFFGVIASVFHGGEKIPAVSAAVADAALPPTISERPAASALPPSGTAAVSTPNDAAAPPPAKRRGFWSRILHVGNDKDQK
jgi:hypothetical protein